ncbi:TetR/AcrR family transcriptional regulator [Agromyces sp. SYSU T00194]|uniref:TetR/AcrR family transcriptional regulator n=1 Tax=Agromyces chitinivorans TaxID=3158560 RepID=UPI00339861DE
MPTPERTSTEQVVAEARRILEQRGADGLTMQAVAAAVGVKAPSLYKRVASRDDLLRLALEATALELGDRVDRALAGAPADARGALAAVADATRSYAAEGPVAFGLLFGALPEAARPRPEVLASASTAVLALGRRLAGPSHELAAARTITAWMTGFVGMQRAGAFRLGGDVEEAWRFGVESLGAALEARRG